MTAESTDLRPMLEAELRRLREDTEVGRRMTALEVLLAENGGPTITTPTRVEAPAPVGRRSPGVSQAKLRAVKQYMAAKGEARQVDVHRDLEENSGSISLALRALEAEGDLEDTGKVENKSKVWRYIGEPGEATKRATVIDVGNEVRPGRKV